jgi:SAM-dependent methyltransferase
MSKKVARPGIRDGYDLWSETYDSTPNPLVALDRRYTIGLLRPQPRERILDAGCGTGGHLGLMLLALSYPVGLDLSRGMLRMARRKFPFVPLAQADLNDRLPVHRRIFDAILCALVSEHVTKLALLFGDFFNGLAAGGRLVFSAFHPEMAAAGIEANFERNGVEHRLGALRYTVDDYLNMIDVAGFRDIRVSEYHGDEALAEQIPWAVKYLRQPLMLAVQATKVVGRPKVRSVY